MERFLAAREKRRVDDAKAGRDPSPLTIIEIHKGVTL
jgi:hypothetical protein